MVLAGDLVPAGTTLVTPALSIRCVRTSSGHQKQHLGVNAARISLHTCINLRNKLVTKSKKLLQIVTLPHTATPKSSH